MDDTAAAPIDVAAKVGDKVLYQEKEYVITGFDAAEERVLIQLVAEPSKNLSVTMEEIGHL